MTGRRATVGLSLLSALLFCAFAAQSASAAVSTSKNITGFTCVKEGGETNKDFKDEHCDEKVEAGKGSFEHKLIPLNQKTEGDATNERVTESTKKSEPAVLKGKILGGLIKANIQCETGKSNAKESTGENSEPVAKGHTASGFGVAELSKCKVVEPAKCVVNEPIIARGTAHAVEGLEGPKGEKNAMAGEVIGAGEKETFAELTFPNNEANKECAARNNTFKVQGKAYATAGPTTESGQENKWSGTTVVATPKFKMEELKFAGEPAEFECITTAKMAGVGGNPVSATTTT
jgi:hypothetical protein